MAIEKPTGLRDGVLILAGIGLLMALLRTASAIVVPFLLALFISVIAATQIRWLKQRGVPNVLSVVIVVFSVVAVLVLVTVMLGSTATKFSQALPGYQSRLNELTNEASTWFAGKGIKIHETGIPKAFDPSVVMKFANKLISEFGHVLSNVFLIMLTVMFMLVEAAGFGRKLAAIEGSAGADALRRIADVVHGVTRYAAANAALSLATGVLIWIGLEIVGLEFAMLWGFIAFALNFVPNIGSIAAAVPAVLLAMLQLDPVKVVVVIGIYLVVNTVIGNLLQPMIMGRSVGLSSLAVFLSVVFWGWMFGPVGMVLSVPLSMVVKSLAQTNPQTQWFAVLLGPSVDPEHASK
jgi:predicted PurR-regulated permease PerM